MKKNLVYFIVSLLLVSMLLPGCSTEPEENQKPGGDKEIVNNFEEEVEISHMEYSDFRDTKKKRWTDLTEEWELHEGDILYNAYNLYNPKVIKTNDKDYPYYMWPFGNSVSPNNDSLKPDFVGSDLIFFARSNDKEHWEMYCGEDEKGNPVWDTTMNHDLWRPVFDVGTHNYDNFHAGDPSVVYQDGKFYMAYSAVGWYDVNGGWLVEGGKTYPINCVMGAVSEDGIHWTKSEAPLLIHEGEFDLDNRTPEGSWKYGGYHRPSLLYVDGVWKLWFDYFLPGTFVSLGCAENTGDFLNPSNWNIINTNDNPQIKNFPNPSVVEYRGTYYAFSDAPGYGVNATIDRQIVCAASNDGKQWEILGKMHPEKDFGCQVPEAFIEVKGGKVWLYVFYSKLIEENAPRYNSINYVRKELT